MKVIYWLLNIVRPLPRRVTIVRQTELTEHELNEIFAGLSDAHPVWRALNQLIDTAERNAWDDAAEHAAKTNLLRYDVARAANFDLLRRDLETRRLLGKAAAAKAAGKRHG